MSILKLYIYIGLPIFIYIIYIILITFVAILSSKKKATSGLAVKLCHMLVPRKNYFVNLPVNYFTLKQERQHETFNPNLIEIKDLVDITD